MSAVEQALHWLTDAIDATGQTDDELLKDDPEAIWTRIICARGALAAAVAETRVAEKKHLQPIQDIPSDSGYYG